MDIPAIPTGTEAPATKTLPPRNSWGAAVLSLIVPGLGHVYAGRARRGIVAAVGSLAVAAGSLMLSMVVGQPVLRVFFFLLAMTAILAVAVDAFRTAARAPEEFAPKWYNRYRWDRVGRGID